MTRTAPLLDRDRDGARDGETPSALYSLGQHDRQLRERRLRACLRDHGGAVDRARSRAVDPVDAS
jgi:hypothetical protein